MRVTGLRVSTPPPRHWPRPRLLLPFLPWLVAGCSLLVPPENADFARKMLTHASAVKIVRIPEMNHFLPWSRYAQVKAVILEHLP